MGPLSCMWRARSRRSSRSQRPIPGRTSPGATARHGGPGQPFISAQTVMHTFATAGCGSESQPGFSTDDDGSYDRGRRPSTSAQARFLPPMTNQPVTNKLKNGQVLPVKIQINDCGGTAVNGLTPAIRLSGDRTTTFDIELRSRHPSVWPERLYICAQAAAAQPVLYVGEEHHAEYRLHRRHLSYAVTRKHPATSTRD